MPIEIPESLLKPEYPRPRSVKTAADAVDAYADLARAQSANVGKILAIKCINNLNCEGPR